MKWIGVLVFWVSTNALAASNRCDDIFSTIKNIGDIKSYLNCVQERIPVGVIYPWDPVVRNNDGTPSGKTKPVPVGWQICNGTNGTPDLTNKFLMGVSSVSKAGKTGGIPDIPIAGAHTHSGDTAKATSTGTHSFRCEGNCTLNTDHKHSFSSSQDGHNHGGENRPPFFNTVFICRTE